MTKIALALAALLMFGCSSVTHFTQKTAGEVRQAVTIHNSEQDSATQYSGPRMQATTDGSDYNLYFYDLRATESTVGGPTQYQLKVDITYRENWRYYEIAELRGRQRLDTAPIKRSILNCVSARDCMYEEILDIALSEEQILTTIHNRDKLKLKLRAKSGHSSTIEVPLSYLMGFYAAIVNHAG
ncbi:hypothetical protein MO867_21090 [Microbulbifer sp. OS29]|uniref:Lipoprotein n=1 Tax=Microbulbifer okhotskensis TaxID=2926617 RepID=A0A9X2ER39_9GAMM|nr:hypothetical protein [Microbulbifer okhotskensis]MCO1336827.1 hypothetical protein [Microbulbifer okhotskensis]